MVFRLPVNLENPVYFHASTVTEVKASKGHKSSTSVKFGQDSSKPGYAILVFYVILMGMSGVIEAHKLHK